MPRHPVHPKPKMTLHPLDSPHSHTGQAADSPRTMPSPRRRVRKAARRQRVGPIRPGRFFRIHHHLAWLRHDMNPRHLGEADWLLYRHRFNPYRPGSWKAQAYERGFTASKKAMPRPNWHPL